MKQVVSIKKNHEFRRLYARGKHAGTNLLVVYIMRNRLGVNRLGITVGKNVGGAVTRNRVRRRIREIFRLGKSRLRNSFDIVVVARPACNDAGYVSIERAFYSACSRLGILTNRTSPADTTT